MQRIYLDHHATTFVAPEAQAAIASHLAHVHGNPSSVHREGRLVRAALEDARAALATSIGAAPRELVFTSGGTEAVHLGVVGVGEAANVRAVWCDAGAHPCMRAACEALASRRNLPLRWLPLRDGAEGEIDVDALHTTIAEDDLVALSLVQHETGAITSWSPLRDALRERRAVVVVDAAQALGKIPLDVQTFGAAAVAMSAHKIGGVAGMGALWLGAGERIAQQLRGGAQERGVRAGTENVLGAVAFGAAAQTIPARLAAQPAIAHRRDMLEASLIALGGVRVNGAQRKRVATACHVSIDGVEGHVLVAALDVEGIAVSSGAACSSGRAEPSESLARIYPHDAARLRGALRVTLGIETTDAEVARAIEVLGAIIRRVRDVVSVARR